MEGSLSEVGTPPYHHLDTLHVLVASYTHTHTKTSSLGHTRFLIVTISDLIPMDHGEKWYVLINSSLETLYGGTRPERENPSGTQLSSSPAMMASTAFHL